MGILDILGGPLAPIFNIVDKLIPDTTAATALKLQLEAARQAGEFQIADSQINTNIEDAKSEHWIQYGWRPFIGWICGGALGYTYILRPLMTDIASFFGHQVALTTLDIGSLMPVLLGMLGLGAMRTIEKSPDAVSQVISSFTGKGKPQ